MKPNKFASKLQKNLKLQIIYKKKNYEKVHQIARTQKKINQKKNVQKKINSLKKIYVPNLVGRQM